MATPGLADPNFARTVVLVLEHGEEGALGVILNRPSALTVAEAVPGWGEAVDPPARVFAGGPVGDGAVIGLAWRPEITAPGPHPSGGGEPAAAAGGDPADRPPSDGWIPLFDGLATIDLGRPPSSFPGLDGVRLFGGYSGWAPGQLDSEMEAGGWFAVDADIPRDVFTPDTDRLWRDVLRRQPGRLSVFAHFPADPSNN